MSTEFNDAEYSDLEARLRKGAPGVRDAASLGRVRARARAKRVRCAPAIRVLATATFLAVVALAIVWGAHGRLEPSSAFAYDRAADMIAPQDGVLHVVIASYDVSSVNDTTPAPDKAGESEPFMSELWLDPSRELARTQIGDSGSSYLLRIEAPGRMLSESKDIFETQPHISEWLAPEGSPSVSVESIGWLQLGWVRVAADAIADRSCEVTEGVTTDGVEVWRVTWDEQLDVGGIVRNEGYFRRSDYRPLSIVQYHEFNGDLLSVPEGDGPFTMQTESSVIRTEIEVWEVLPRDEVPADIFETRADLGAEAASFDVRMTPDDPRIAEIGFPIWGVSADAGFGPPVFAIYRKGNVTGFALERSGAFTLQYGESTTCLEPGPVSTTNDIFITTCASGDEQDIEQYWANHVVGSVELNGEVDGRSYRIRAGSHEGALLVGRVDDTVVIISGPDADTVLAVLGALEPLQ